MEVTPHSQLARDIDGSIETAIQQHRPILHHLNADTSWLLQLPRPILSTSRSGRHWFNILIDPWLMGSQSDVASWFSTQTHAEAPALSSIAEVENLARKIESLSVLAFSKAPGEREQYTYEGTSSENEGIAEGGSFSPIDAIAISHEFTDHCHKETLLQCSPRTPVFTTRKAVDVVKSFKHFHTVLETPTFGADVLDWRATSIAPLPEWLAIGRLVTGGDVLYYHSALLILFDCKHVRETRTKRLSMNGHTSGFTSINSDGNDCFAEAVIYTPHGIHASSLQCISKSRPHVETLAFMHGLHDVAISKQQLNLGAHNGLEAQKSLNAKYWIGTHDEVKKGGGLVTWFLRRKVISLEDAIKQAARKAGGYDATDETVQNVNEKSMSVVQFRELRNGESSVLV